MPNIGLIGFWCHCTDRVKYLFAKSQSSAPCSLCPPSPSSFKIAKLIVLKVRLTHHKCDDVCQGQVGKVDVGGRLHVLVAHYHYACRHVAQDSHDQEEGVDDGERD